MFELKDLILTNPSELHGNNFVTEEVEQASKITATAINVSSAIDGASIFPLLLYSFKDMGPVGLVFAFGLALAQTKFTNSMGKAVANRKPGNKAWSTFATLAMLGMNTVISLSSLVAPELSLNQPHLAELKAIELVDEQEQKVNNRIQPDFRAANEADAECKRLQKKLEIYPEASVQRIDLFLQAYGKYDEQKRDWRQVLQTGKERVPFCHLSPLLKEDALKVSQAAKSDWENKKVKIIQSASYVAGIKQVMPALYEQHFDDKKQLISGTEATRLAIQSTTSKLMTGNWNGLGFSLFFFATSVITSAGACSLAIAHSFREDIQMSFDESLQIKLDEFLEDS